MGTIKHNLRGAEGWRMTQTEAGWRMEHPLGIEAELDGGAMRLTVRRASDGKILLNEDVAEDTLEDVATMLGNVARDVKMAVGGFRE